MSRLFTVEMIFHEARVKPRPPLVLPCAIPSIMATGMHNRMSSLRGCGILPVFLQSELSCIAAGGSRRVDESAAGMY